MKLTDYTLEYCPVCDNEVVIHAYGVTRCPVCGPLQRLVACALRNREDARLVFLVRMAVTERMTIYTSL